MVRVGLFGKSFPLLGVSFIIILPLLGTGLAMVYPIELAAVPGGFGLSPVTGGNPDAQPQKPADPATPDERAVAEEPAVIVSSENTAIQVENAPPERQVSIRTDGTGFWFSTQINESHQGSTIKLWVDINNTAPVSKRARLVLKPEAPLTVGDNLGTPSSSQHFVMEKARSTSRTNWLLRVGSADTGRTVVKDEPIENSEAIKYRTDHVVMDRNRDGNITTADLDFRNVDVSDGVSGIDDLRLNDDGTVTLYLNGSTNSDETYDAVTYDSGEYLVIPLKIPEDVAPGTYTLEGEFSTLD